MLVEFNKRALISFFHVEQNSGSLFDFEVWDEYMFLISVIPLSTLQEREHCR
jgi:hypothetical protein